jgi:hypothetical protein
VRYRILGNRAMLIAVKRKSPEALCGERDLQEA